jgi:RNA-directed DNA polymerase
VRAEALAARDLTMIRQGALKNIWCNYDALLQAWQEVRTGKTCHYSILQYENNLACNLNDLLDRLINNTYEVRPTRDFYVWEPKKRFIQAPHLEDRIVQHALMNAIRDTIENRFIHDTYACRKGKGTHAASARLQQFLIAYKNVGYYLKVDIEKFFYNINHKRLIKQLDCIIKDADTLDLLKKFFDNAEGKGLPLGSVTSQLLANLSLNPVDHLVKRYLHIQHYLRYMDDFVLLSTSKVRLNYCKGKIEEIVEYLGMRINHKTKIGKLKDGIDFVGYRTWYNCRLIRKRSLYKIGRTLKNDFNQNRMSSYLAHSKDTNSLPYVIKQIMQVVPDQVTFIKSWVHKNVKQNLQLKLAWT